VCFVHRAVPLLAKGARKGHPALGFAFAGQPRRLSYMSFDPGEILYGV
jgi:hypothetical protein